jgi:hypothetical protein
MRVRLAWWCTLAVLVGPTAPRAQAEPSAAPPPAAPDATVVAEEMARTESGRALNGHLFNPSLYIVTPFSVTSFGAQTIYGYSNVAGPSLDVAGRTIGNKHYPTAAYGSSVQLSARIIEPLSFRLDATGYIFSGVKTQAALVVGLNATYAVDGGFTLGTKLAPGLRGAITFDVSYRPSLNITPAAALSASAAAGMIVSNELFFNANVLQYRPGISLAWAPHPAFGLIAEGRYLRFQVEKSGADAIKGNAWEASALADFDLHPLSPVPIAIYGVFRFQDPFNAPGISRTENAGGGIFYTGRVHLAVGLEATYQWFHIRQQLNTRAGVVDLGLRYYW